MLSGKRAFNGDSTVEVINANLKNDPAELPSSVPSPHQRIVHRCLEKDPSRRFQSAADVGFALLAVSDAGMSLPPVTPKRGIWLKWIAAAAAVAILVGAGAYWAGGTRPLAASLAAPFFVAAASYFFCRLQFRHFTGWTTAGLCRQWPRWQNKLVDSVLGGQHGTAVNRHRESNVPVLVCR